MVCRNHFFLRVILCLLEVQDSLLSCKFLKKGGQTMWKSFKLVCSTPTTRMEPYKIFIVFLLIATSCHINDAQCSFGWGGVFHCKREVCYVNNLKEVLRFKSQCNITFFLRNHWIYLHHLTDFNFRPLTTKSECPNVFFIKTIFFRSLSKEFYVYTNKLVKRS